ncbi:MAG: ZIP family metal transporter [Verrucomicrobia bacterium]|jgi:zinc and cadmium transporter|nr:ZIP family metal transporter [Verrucomicrobiota bacterium]
MNTPTLVIYCVAVLVVSLVGGSIPGWLRLTHTRLQIALSFVAGLMLGIALLHMIPHAAAETGSLDHTVQWTLAGFLVLFFLQRVFHYHSHDTPGEEAAADCCPAHGAHAPAAPTAKSTTWLGTALGLGLHSLLDGVALAAAVAAGKSHGVSVGLGAALAVILHKPFDALAVTTLMQAANCAPKLRRWVNVIFAMVTPLGALLFTLGMGETLEANHAVLGAALAFCGGSFLCIAASDLLPELHFHSHDRAKLSIALLAGIGIAVLVGLTEGEEHGHGHEPHERSATQPAQI